MKTLLDLIDKLCMWCENLAVVLIYAIALVMLGEVIARSVFSISLPFSWDYASYGMAAAFLLGSGHALIKGAHIRVVVLQGVLSPSWAHRLDAFATAVGLVLVTLLTYSLSQIVVRSMARGVVSNTVMQTPLAIPQSIVLIGACVLWLAFLARLIKLLTGQLSSSPFKSEH